MSPLRYASFTSTSWHEDSPRTFCVTLPCPLHPRTPLQDEAGEFFGTLCHFDLVQRPLSPENLELLQQGAELIRPLLPKTV